ncbi:hypothetical protein ALC57_14394 [Trachymyrmex cornetzi]|uniref:Uncharacterized protein n=1 Tax=Trachymyrmex cornetzi TaxID=471704 RepID=A0A195DKK5_9HYME|nr:hypothetical protein ALC57_14394 [Trachymyrmex cornetzi]
MYQNQARGCFMDGNARKYALLVLLLDYGTAETPEKGCSRTQAGRVNAGSKVLVRTEFPTLDAGYEA